MNHIRQLLDGDVLSFALALGRGRDTDDPASVRHIAHDTGFGRDDSLVPDFEVVGDAGLRSDHDIVTQLRAACKTDLPHNDAMTSNRDVVRNVDEIVDLCPLADDGGAQCAAINRGIGADLNVIADDDVAKLKDFPVEAFVKDITEAIRADDRARVNDYAPSELRLAVKD